MTDAWYIASVYDGGGFDRWWSHATSFVNCRIELFSFIGAVDFILPLLFDMRELRSRMFGKICWYNAGRYTSEMVELLID